MANNYPIITISREYASGGRSVAKALSERLQIPWYDKDLITITAEHSGYSKEEIEAEGEELSKMSELLDKLLNNSVAYTSSHDAIFEAQKDAVLELAQKPCIIVGRCANSILRQANVESLNIFLYADMDTKLARARELKPDFKGDLKKYVEKRDALRSTYYKKYAESGLDNCHDYHICLDTGKFEYAECVDFIVKVIEKGM